MEEIIDLLKLRKILVKMPEVKLAYLIGSVATGITRKDSDLDIVLVLEKGAEKGFDYGKTYLLLEETVNHPNLDLRIATEETDPLFLFQVTAGNLIYAKNEAERVCFEAKTMVNFYDTQHLRGIFHHYLNQRIKEGKYGRAD
ncbi:MAG: nucleotidyltransferase domain-containing protein [bacterium]|nr:nucleotidyltransferase domain-containing protein [bacterium]